MSDTNIDEPQFSVENTESNEKGRKPLISLTFLIVLIVALFATYDDIVGYLSSLKNSNAKVSVSELPNSPMGVNANLDYEVSGSDILKAELLVNETSGVAVERDNASHGDVNIVILDRLDQLSIQLTDLRNQLLIAQDSLKQGFNSEAESFRSLSASMTDVGVAVSNMELNNTKRHAFNRKTINKFREFSANVKDQEAELDFEILHAESWGGKMRIIGYDRAQRSRQIGKVYVGDYVGEWVLSDISESHAIFTFTDGSIKQVRLP